MPAITITPRAPDERFRFIARHHHGESMGVTVDGSSFMLSAGLNDEVLLYETPLGLMVVTRSPLGYVGIGLLDPYGSPVDGRVLPSWDVATVVAEESHRWWPDAWRPDPEIGWGPVENYSDATLIRRTLHH